MKKIVLSAAIAALMATPAMARVITMEFTVEGGESQIWKFDDATKKATAPDGKVYDYTRDEAARKICATTPEGELCATFAEDGEIAKGASSPYKATNGNEGVATITDISE